MRRGFWELPELVGGWRISLFRSARLRSDAKPFAAAVLPVAGNLRSRLRIGRLNRKTGKASAPNDDRGRLGLALQLFFYAPMTVGLGLE